MAANVLAVGLIAVAVHSWPMAELVRSQVAALAAEQAGMRVSIGRVRYNLFTLSLAADDTAVSALDGEVPVAFARRVAIDLSWRALLAGGLEPRRVVVSELDVAAWSLSRDSGVDLRRLSLEMNDTGGSLAGRLELAGPASVRIAAATSALDALEGALDFDGETLAVRQLRLSGAGIEIDAAGTVKDLLEAQPNLSAHGTWRGEAGRLCAMWIADAASCEPVRDGRLRGRFALGGLLSAPVFEIEGTGDHLRTPGGLPFEIDATALVSAGTIEISRLDASAFGGTASLRGALLIGGPSRTSSARLRWHTVDLRALTREAGFAVPIAAMTDGEATLIGDLLDPPRMTVEAQVQVVALPGTGVPAAGLVTARLGSGQWLTRVAGGRIGATTVDGAFSGRVAPQTAEWMDASLSGSVQLASPDLHGALAAVRTLGLRRIPVEQAAGWGARADARLRLDGTLGRPEVAGTVTLATPPGNGAPGIDASAEVRIDGAAIHVQPLSAGRGDDRLSATVHYQWDSQVIDSEFTATLEDVAAIAAAIGQPPPSIDGPALIAGHVTGTASHPELDAMLHAGDADVALTAAFAPREPGWPFAATVTLLNVAVHDLAPTLLERAGLTARIDAAVVATGRADQPDGVAVDVTLTRIEASVHGVDAALLRPAHLRLDSWRVAEAQVALQVGELGVEVTRTSLDAPLHLVADGRMPPVLGDLPESPAVAIDAFIDPRRIDIRRAFVQSGETTGTASGQIPVRFLHRWLPAALHAPADEDVAPASLSVDARFLPLGVIARRMWPSVPAGVDGAVDLQFTAETDDPALANVRLDGRLERGRIDAGGIGFTQDGAATLTLHDGMASLSGWRWTAPGADLTLRAESAVDADARRFDAALAGDVDLGQILQRPGSRAGGMAHLDLAARHDGERLTWTGQANLRDGTWVSRQQGVALTDVEATVTCQLTGCRVERMAGGINGGTFAMSGDAPVPGGGAAALHAVVRGVTLEAPKGTLHDVDADLDLAGETPRLTGTVTVWPGTVTTSLVGLAGVLGSSRTPTVSERDDGAAPGANPLSRIPLDVRVVSSDDLSFDSHDLQLTATSDLRLRGTLAAPQLSGQVTALDRGRIFLAGRSWDLEEGSITLAEGPGGTAARVAATLSAPISKYLVQINLSGPASAPRVVMTSDPALGQSDLTELVLTGTTTGSAGRAGGQQLVSMVSTELLSSAGRVMGVDAVRIEQGQSELSATELEPVSRLTVSKRITNQFDVVYSQGLSESDDVAWVLVYRPGWRALDVRATIRTNGAEAYELRQELEFGSSRPRAPGTRARRQEPLLVSDVAMDGLSPDDAAALRDELSLQPGKPFTTERWQRDRQTVTRYFQDRDRLAVRVRATHTRTPDGRYALAYRVTPGPVVQLELRGYEPRRSTVAALRQAWSQVVVEELLAEELGAIVRVDLASRGYLTPEVTTRLAPLPDAGRLVTLDVVPGPRTRRRSIVFTGNAAIADGDLSRTVAEQGIGPRSWIAPSLLEEPIAAQYHALGYLAARATAVRTIAGSRAAITVHVDEGRPYAVGDVMVSGAASLGEPAARTGFALAPGARFSGAALDAAVNSLRVAYSRAGYLAAEVESSATVRHDAGVVDLAVTVNEGPLSVLRQVQLTGLGESPAAFLMRVLDVPTGGPVDSVTLDQGQQRLYETGIFRTVDVDLRPADGAAVTAAAESVDATVAVEERAKYRLRYGVQFGPTTIDNITNASNNSEPGASIDLQRRNLFGRGIVAGAGGVWSADQHRIRGTISASTLGRRFATTTFSIEHANQDRVSSDDVLHIVDRSARAVLEQRWKVGLVRRMEFAYGFNVDNRRLELRATTAAPLPLRGRIADLNATFTYDSRDDRFNPSRGTFHTSRVEAGAGLWLSDIAFGRYQFQHFTYYPLGGVTLASGLRFGSLDVDQERQPASLMLFFKTGGGTTVRGYEDDSLTPGYILGAPAGGKALLVFNEEVRIPVTRRFGVVGFVDAGNTFRGLDAISFDGLKVGIGSGVRVDTPVAVLRLDIAMPVPRLPAGRRARWYVSIGQAF